MAGPGKPGRKHTLTQDVADRILGFLGDGSAPFISLAAERAGVRRGLVKDWLAQAEHDQTTNELVLWFASEVRRIRAGWMAKITQELQAPVGEDNKHSHHQARHKSWLLERVDRDLFDLTQRYLPKPDKRVVPEPADPIEPLTMGLVLDELEKPDVHGTH